jgi:cytochrome c-type biogenesis protein CcmF
VLVLGRLAVTLALVFSLASILFLALGVRRDNRDLIRNGYFAVYGMFLCIVIASAVLLQAFIAGNYTFRYVFENSQPSLGLFYRIAGFWAEQQGSFLLWLFFLVTVTVIIAMRNLRQNDRLTAGAVMVLSIIAAAFATLLVFDPGSRPFLKTDVIGAVPSGLNPLLLHPAMVLHPPALFMGYVGLAVPFAFAASAMMIGQSDRLWVKLSQKWTVTGWLFLSLGIGLGAWWAYVVLGYGGYWGWDPVENTSLIPWLTATALLHSMHLYAKRGIFKRWALSLAAATFWLTLIATWTTRSGLIQSVHAFGTRAALVVMLSSFVVAVAVVSIVLIAWRWRRFRADHEYASLLSRDLLYSATNVGLAVFATVLLVATVVVPLVTSNTRVIGPKTYNLVAQPLGVVVLFAIGLCPLLSWGRTEGRTLWRNARWPLGVAVASVPLWLFTGNWRTSAGGFVGLVVSTFSAVAVLEFIVLRARKSAGDGGFARGLGRALTFSRSRTAGMVAHIGMVLVVFGLIGSNVYKVQQNVLLDARPGASATVQAYTVKFVGFRTGTAPQDGQTTYATLDVYKNGKKVAVLAPHTDVYPNSQAPAMRAVILGSLGQDLFVTPNAGFDNTATQIALQIDVFPLIGFVWVGALVLCAGSVVSLWPKAERQRATASERAPATEAA